MARISNAKSLKNNTEKSKGIGILVEITVVSNASCLNSTCKFDLQQSHVGLEAL